MPGQLLIAVLALNFTRLSFYDHRGHPVHHVTSGLATVIPTVHQKSAVIFDNSLMWQDTGMIKASIYCNPILGFLARLGGSCLRENSIWLSADASSSCTCDDAQGSLGDIGRKVDGIRARTRSYKQNTVQATHF
jgi:hypothetical protein